MTSPTRSFLQPEYIWFDGKLVAAEDATIHFLNPTLHYGPGVFEGIRCYGTSSGPAVFRLREHLERFLDSIRALGILDVPFSYDELRDAVCRTILANNYVECYVRPMMFFTGNGYMGLNIDKYEPVFAVAAWRWNDFIGQEARQHGLRATVSSITRTRSNVALIKAKVSGQYVNSVIAKTLAKRAGFDEAILLDSDGYVAECTGENLMMVQGDRLCTSPSMTVLGGITRDTVMVLAKALGYGVVEERLSLEDLYTADEVFVCGTAAEVVGVREVDGRVIGNGRIGPVTQQLTEMYDETVHGRNEYAVHWLDQMTLEPLI